MDSERFGAYIEWPLERKCSICGRIFCMVCTPEEWPLKDKKQHILFCSWRCLREYEAKEIMGGSRKRGKKDPKRPPKEKERMFGELIRRGLNNKEIAEQTGESEQLVNYYRRKIQRREEMRNE